MKKNEMKNLLFEKFQQRVVALENRKKENLAKIQKLINEGEQILGEMQRLREETGIDIVFNLSENGQVNAIEGEQGSPQTEVRPRQRKGKKTNVRRRKRQKPGQPTIQKILDDNLPEIIKMVGSKNKEFTARQVYNALAQNGLPDERVKRAHVSLYLSQNKKKLGIKSEARKVKMPKVPMPIITNFFTLARRSSR